MRRAVRGVGREGEIPHGITNGVCGEFDFTFVNQAACVGEVVTQPPERIISTSLGENIDFHAIDVNFLQDKKTTLK